MNPLTARPRGWAGVALLLLGASAHAAAAAGPERVSAADLKAAFLLNFVTFTEWPNDAAGTVRLCIVADAAVGDALAATLRGRTGAARPVSVAALPQDAPMRGCQAVFIGSATTPPTSPMFDQLAAAGTLTVSDTPRFAEGGGMIGLFIEDGRMRFAVNVDALQRARLRLSSRVLSLARIVKDTHAP